MAMFKNNAASGLKTINTQFRLKAGLRYAELGLAIQPIHWVNGDKCSCGKPLCKSVGKHPCSKSGYHDSSSDEATIRGWFSKWPKMNVGLTMGQERGKDEKKRKLVALDIDPRNGGDEALAELLDKHGKLPDTAMQLTQGGGFHYLFWSPGDATFPSLLGPGVEIKTKNHINVYPSVGPLGKYEWEASGDLLAGAAIVEVPDWILLFSVQKKTQTVVSTQSVFTDPATFAELKEALPYIPPKEYQKWIDVGQALKTLGSQGFGLWNNWSQLSAKYEAKVMRPKWESFNPNQINIESIFHIAEEYGWVNSARSDQASFDEMAAKANRVQRVVAKPAIERPDLMFPESGAESLETVASLLQSGGNVRNADAGRIAALMMLSHTAGRGYITEYDEPVQLYGVLCAPSIGEVGHFKSTLFKLFEDAGISGARQLRASSSQSIYHYLHKSPSLLNIISDFGQQLYHARRQYSNTLDQAFGTMSELFDGKDLTFDPSEFQIRPSGSEQNFKLFHPALTLFGLMSEDRIPYFLSNQELGRGSLEQYLFAFAHPDQTELSEPQPLIIPSWLLDHLKRIRTEPPITEHSTVVVHSEAPANERTVRFADKPDGCYAEIMALSDRPQARTLLIAARTQVRRLASLLAIWNNPESPIVSQNELDYATRYVIVSLNAMLERLRLMENEDGKLSAAQKITGFIHKFGAEGVTNSHLTNYCGSFKKMTKKEDRYNMIIQLIEDGDIIEKQTSNKRGMLYIHTDFAELQ